MNMFIISYFYRKNVLGFDINYYMYFQISSLIFLMPFVFHPLASIFYFNTGTIYCNNNIFGFDGFFSNSIFNFDIQLVYSSAYCSVIWDRWYFSTGMSSCAIPSVCL